VQFGCGENNCLLPRPFAVSPQLPLQRADNGATCRCLVNPRVIESYSLRATFALNPHLTSNRKLPGLDIVECFIKSFRNPGNLLSGDP